MPNLHDALRCDADILQLDVVAVGEVMPEVMPEARPSAVPQVGARPVDASSDDALTGV